ncbi:NUDIX domain-containing protein [Streptomyces olivaceoviridis]
MPQQRRHSGQGRYTAAGPEDFAAAAIRELTEETGLVADPSDAHVVTMLVDDNHGVPRLTAVVRITAWTGTLTTGGPSSR